MKKIITLTATLLISAFAFAQTAGVRVNGNVTVLKARYNNPNTGQYGTYDNSARPHGHGHHTGVYAMAPQHFEQAFRSIANQTFDSSKLTVATQIVNANNLNTNQVRRIMGLFSFESSRLKFAKFAYDRVIDPQNFYLVNDAFTFSSSIRELDRHIQNSGRQSGNYDYGYNGQGTYNTPGTCGSNPVSYGPVAMNDHEFNRLLESVRYRQFESTRMDIIKQALRSNFLTTSQVKMLMYELTFESSRLDLAKFAYNYTVDKHNYYLVNDAFTFDSSIRDLNEYLTYYG